MDTVTLKIDGKQVRVIKGARILEAAQNVGIYIPNLCAINNAELPSGACRLCFVEIEGRRNPVTACTEPAVEGMVVHTDTPRVNRLRRTAAELILATYPADCGNCLKNRHCELQKVASYLGIKLKPKRLRRIPRTFSADSSNPFFTYDPNKCILCGKCVWVCNEHLAIDAIDFTSRGFESRVSPFDNAPLVDSRCTSCGECVALCPVSALLPRNFKWPDQEVKTICPYCNIGCGLYLGIRNNEVVNVRGDSESLVNKGALCVRGRFGITELVHHPQRLTTPLVRQNGELREASWEEALDLVATRLTKYKGDRFGLISSATSTNEDSYVAQKFCRTAMGTNNIDNCFCHAPSSVILLQGFGSSNMLSSIGEISQAGCTLVIGANPSLSQPIIEIEIKKAKRRGAKLIIVNPKEIELCRFADLWLRPRPDTDLALLIGMMQVIVEEGLQDSEFIAQHCESFTAFRDSLQELDLGLIEEVTGISEELAAEAARTFATHQPAIVFYGSGITRHTKGADGISAIVNLVMLTGNIGKPAAGIGLPGGQSNAQGTRDMGVLPDFYPGYQAVDAQASKEKFEAVWGYPLKETRGLNLGGILHAAHHGQVKALYIIGANPVPTTAQAQQALERVEFLIVQDAFLSETAQKAHVVLPAATFAEKDGTFTNLERRIQLVRQGIKPIGDSRPDWQIVCQIAKKMDVKGFDFEHPAQIMEELARLTPSYAGISYERLEKGGLQWPCPNEDHRGTPVLHPQTFVQGKGSFVPLEYKPPAEPPDREYPLTLITERSLYHYSSIVSGRIEGLDILAGEEMVEVNPLDAAAMKISDAEGVRVVSRHGEMRARAKLTEAVPPGVICMTPHFAEMKAGAARIEKSYNG